MLKNYTAAQPKTETYYTLCFDDGCHNGFGFPCDTQGNPLNLTPEAQKNMAWCLEHPEKFVRFNKVEKRTDTYYEPPYGTCECGSEIHFCGPGYYGAFQCRCGKWYNVFGQELCAPMSWEERLDADY